MTDQIIQAMKDVERACVPVGSIVLWLMGVPWDSRMWLVCGPTSVSRTDYPELFKMIGTRYGEGDGRTTFDLPQIAPPPGLYYIIRAK